MAIASDHGGVIPIRALRRYPVVVEFASEWVRFRYDFSNAFWLAFDSIRAHKLRSFLTLLGVIIGVASVILVGSAVEGLGVYAEQSTAKAFGSETYMVAQIAVTSRLSRREHMNRLKRNKPIRDEDVRYLLAVNGETTFYSPYRQKAADLKHKNLLCEGTSVLGVSADLARIRDIIIVDGRFFTEQEERSRSYVAVIGDDVRATLFPDGSSPLDRKIKMDGLEFTVVGVQEKLGSAFGRSQDNAVYIPIPVFTRMYGPAQALWLYGRPKPGTGLTLSQSLDLTRVALRTRFHTRPGRPDNFDSLTPEAIRGFIDSVLGMITAIVVPVSCISLVVGGIVIMNIMLVSVTERTHEIGVRKSLGARRSDVLMQILIEAVLMAGLGGLLGVGLGAVFTLVLSNAFEVDLHITAGYVILALVVSSIVGIASGWYPASRASRLDPVAALRAE